MGVPIIGILIIWNLVGFIIDLIWISLTDDLAPWELCNPRHSYKYYYSVNWFGALIISLIYTTLCPAMAVIYWFCILCSVGRRN